MPVGLVVKGFKPPRWVGLLPSRGRSFALNFTCSPKPSETPQVHAVLSPYWAFVFGEPGKNTNRREPHAPVRVSGFGGAYWTDVAKLGDEVDEKPAVGSGAAAI